MAKDEKTASEKATTPMKARTFDSMTGKHLEQALAQMEGQKALTLSHISQALGSSTAKGEADNPTQGQTGGVQGAKPAAGTTTTPAGPGKKE